MSSGEDLPLNPGPVESRAGQTDPGPVESRAGQTDPGPVESRAGQTDPGQIESRAGQTDPGQIESRAGQTDAEAVETPAAQTDPNAAERAPEPADPEPVVRGRAAPARGRPWRLVLALILILIWAAVYALLGDNQPAAGRLEAYCRTARKVRQATESSTAQPGPATSVGPSSAEARGERSRQVAGRLLLLFAQARDAAPPEVRSDLALTVTAYGRAIQEGNPARLDQLTRSAPVQRINRFTASNC